MSENLFRKRHQLIEQKTLGNFQRVGILEHRLIFSTELQQTSRAEIRAQNHPQRRCTRSWPRFAAFL